MSCRGEALAGAPTLLLPLLALLAFLTAPLSLQARPATTAAHAQATLDLDHATRLLAPPGPSTETPLKDAEAEDRGDDDGEDGQVHPFRASALVRVTFAQAPTCLTQVDGAHIPFRRMAFPSRAPPGA